MKNRQLKAVVKAINKYCEKGNGIYCPGHRISEARINDAGKLECFSIYNNEWAILDDPDSLRFWGPNNETIYIPKVAPNENT